MKGSHRFKQKKVYTRKFRPKPVNEDILSSHPTIRVLKKYGRFNKWAKANDFLKNPTSTPEDSFEVYDTTSGGYHADLSPMVLGPVNVDGKFFAYNIEDGWQGSKVWGFHMRGRFDPTAPLLWRDDESGPFHSIEGIEWLSEWNKWSQHIRLSGEGKRHRAKVDPEAANPNAPLFSYFRGERLSYVEARKKMYIPWYAELVQNTDSYDYLQRRFRAGTSLILLDPDGQERDQNWEEQYEWTLRKRIDNPALIFGHAFVLAAILQDITVW